MARPPKAGLTDYELTLMRILWDESPLGVAGVLAKLRRRPKPAYTSLQTVLTVMSRKGYVDSVKRGKAFLFRPILEKDEYRRLELRRLVCTLYDGDAKALAGEALRLAQPDSVRRRASQKRRKSV